MALFLFGVAIDSGRLRGPVTRLIASHAGRPIQFNGPFQAHVLSLHPRFTAQRVIIGNPPWMPAGEMADIGSITLVIQLPWFGRSFCVESVATQSAALHLTRYADGRANWQWRDPAKTAGGSLAIIHSLSMPDARFELDDNRRHLKFEGTASAVELNDASGAGRLRIKGSGQLNSREVHFQIEGDPLASANRRTPYHFTFMEQSSESDLAGDGLLPQPFNFDVIDAAFRATGADLKDLYFLTGVTLINTGSYRLSGKLERRGTDTRFLDLSLTSGESEVKGTVSIDTSRDRPQFAADLSSQRLRVKDLGALAAGRDREAAAKPTLLLSNTTFDPAAARRGDGVVSFHARRIDVGRVPLLSVAGKATFDHGTVVLSPFVGDVFDGQLTAHVRLDATTDTPQSDFDIKVVNLQLGQYLDKGAQPPPMEGLLQIRINAKGRGRSIHQVAASADGTVTAVLPHGKMRASLAELTGIDLRGLGMKFVKSTKETEIHCAVASFRARGGTLTSTNLVIDTDPILILGSGAAHLDLETLDLELRGHPKEWRLLQVHLPVQLQGTLTQPVFHVGSHSSSEASSDAVDLGALFASLPASFTFVDPALAKNADCIALLAEASNPRVRGSTAR
jgi:uncharacterized protein involved in outer membrane biogenesis